MSDGWKKYENHRECIDDNIAVCCWRCAIGVCAIASMVIVGQAGKKSELKKAAEVVASIAGIVLAICFIAGMMLNGIH
jgi:quinol-cytochrome oxidoreductase complex cytochrome b subunit